MGSCIRPRTGALDRQAAFLRPDDFFAGLFFRLLDAECHRKQSNENFKNRVPELITLP